MAHHDTDFQPLALAVLTVSDTRTPDNDTSGDLLADRARQAGELTDSGLQVTTQAIEEIRRIASLVTQCSGDVEQLAAYRHEKQVASDTEQVDADAALAKLERARAATLARIEMESDIAQAQARGEVAAELEHELK